MKTINSSTTIKIPTDVKVSVNARTVTVTGPRGTLTKDFKHVDIEILATLTAVRLQVWFGSRKHKACIRTVATHIENLIRGVTKGYQYKMKTVYAHFPININIADDKKSLEIRNFLGEKVVRRIPMLEGVTVAHTNVKDEICLTGSSIERVSQSAASIYQSSQVKNKDVRKFLDGIYVSEHGVIKGKDN